MCFLPDTCETVHQFRRINTPRCHRTHQIGGWKSRDSADVLFLYTISYVDIPAVYCDKTTHLEDYGELPVKVLVLCCLHRLPGAVTNVRGCCVLSYAGVWRTKSLFIFGGTIQLFSVLCTLNLMWSVLSDSSRAGFHVCCQSEGTYWWIAMIFHSHIKSRAPTRRPIL